jgi:hypothetical protein
VTVDWWSGGKKFGLALDGDGSDEDRSEFPRNMPVVTMLGCSRSSVRSFLVAKE